MFDYKKYREQRYANGGNSGAGSYGDNAFFKADYINKFISDKKIDNIIEIGCGDGNNLKLYDGFKQYIGLDVSETALDRARKSNKGDRYIFMKYPKDGIKSDLVLCLDVTYHIFPREERKNTINDCINKAEKYVMFYSFLKPKGHAIHINDYDLEKYLTYICSEKNIDMYIDKKNIPPNSQSRFIILSK